MCINSRCEVKLLLGKLRILLHGEIGVGEVAVGEISDWGSCCWGSCDWENCVGEVAVGKRPNTPKVNLK